MKKHKFFQKLTETISYGFSYILNKITTMPSLTSFLFFLVILIVLSIIKNSYYNTINDFNKGLLIELFGTTFDIFIVGFIILWLNKKGEINRDNQNSQRDLYDFQRMESTESILIKILRIRKLNRNGISNIDLANNNINHADLRSVNFSGADLQNCKLIGCDLQNAIFYKAQLQNADLSDAEISNADFQHADIRGAKITFSQLVNAKTLYEAQIDDHLLKRIKSQVDECQLSKLFSPAYYWSSKESKSIFHKQR